MRKPLAFAASVLALVLVMAGCASNTASSEAPSAGGGTGYPISIVVDNGLSNLQAITVYIQRDSGGRQMLGSVESGRKHTFTYTAGNGVYTLSARRGSGQEDIVSDKIALSGATTLTWRLPSNVVIGGN